MAEALMSQTEARRLAEKLVKATGLPHVAHTVPLGCWGGMEKGWAVSGPGLAFIGREALQESDFQDD